MSDVPPELITVILTHLPVKSLLRFRCVSKSLRTLIDSPSFIKSHLNQSLISHSHQTLITVCPLNGRICSADLDSVENRSLLSHRGYMFLGSCNGLLCLTNGIGSVYFYLGVRSPNYVDINLYNPSTRECRKLPSYVFDNYTPVCDNVVHGFGYDCVGDDYKVVQIIQCDDDKRHDDFAVCSLKSNSWRRILNFPYYICRNADNVFINGALHWVVTLKPHTRGSCIADFNVDVRIVSFDLATEEYRFVPQPEISARNLLMHVGELGGRLCLHGISEGKFMDLWVMDRYGIKESWNKLLSVVQSVDIRRIRYLKAIAFSMDGQRVLFQQGGGKLFWYDLRLKRKRVKRARIRVFTFTMYVCTGSLVKLADAALLQEQCDTKLENL